MILAGVILLAPELKPTGRLLLGAAVGLWGVIFALVF